MRVFYNYTEKALKPQIYSQMVRKNLEKKSFQVCDSLIQEVMHQLYLYQNNVSIFDYDYYNECSYSLIKEQKSLNLSEIMTVLKLGLQHNIKNEMLWKHFENEFFLRLDNSMGSLIRNQDKLEKKEMEKMFTMLNKNN